MNLIFYTSVAKRMKLKVKKFYGLVPTFVEVTEEKLVGGGAFLLPPSWIGLRLPLSHVQLIFNFWETIAKIIIVVIFKHEFINTTRCKLYSE